MRRFIRNWLRIVFRYHPNSYNQLDCPGAGRYYHYIDNANGKSKMNTHYQNRAKQAIAECDRFIAKEEKRNPATRPADVQKYLEFCKTRRAEMASLLLAA